MEISVSNSAYVYLGLGLVIGLNMGSGILLCYARAASQRSKNVKTRVESFDTQPAHDGATIDSSPSFWGSRERISQHVRVERVSTKYRSMSVCTVPTRAETCS